MTLELHNTENPISNTERLKINENWQRIISGYSYLQQQIKVLAGGAEVDELIQRLNEAVDGANVAVQQAIDANNTATQEAIEANNKALQDALTTVSQTLVDVNKAIANANTATSEANTAKQGALDATTQAHTALGAMHSLITNLGSKGVWNDTTQFYKNNLAVFNGSTFIALQDNLGKTPPTLPTQSNAYWSLFAEKGATGNTGLQGPPGKDGTGVTIIGSLPSETDLPPVGAPGDAYMIEGNLYVWQDNTKTWKNVGPIQGPQGKSAYDLAVENGFIGTMEEWIESLKGMQGPPGPEGPPGPPADLTEINQQVSTLETEVTEHVTGIATTEKLGHIKPDGTTITVNPVTGVASAEGGIGDVIEYNGDLNNLVKTGFYYYPAGTLNSPTAAGGFIQVIANEENVFQISQSLINGLSNYFYAKRVARKVNGSFVWGVDGYTELNGWAPPTRINDSLTSSTKYEGASANAVKQVNDKLRATWIADSTTNIPFGQDYSGAVRFRKVLTTVEVILDLKVVLTDLTPNVEYIMFTLPVGYRTQEAFSSSVVLLTGSVYNYIPIRINPNGQVLFRNSTSVAQNSLIKGQFTFATGESLN
ncbi:hypothetical protein LYSIN_01227 [Lysinibacillus sphaericus]|uniref:Tail fiber protein n=1 Tax=Lysinibacillus sphaericus TaxID=1421 RepID=A0A2S5D056_LYSSH|nr:pyocin knob domain-containing protein [Lysinibacillus sphaericus]POZ56444.1 hypothetical protein LYSIN_01227 [Lysinibacillus sphaericus]